MTDAPQQTRERRPRSGLLWAVPQVVAAIEKERAPLLRQRDALLTELQKLDGEREFLSWS